MSTRNIYQFIFLVSLAAGFRLTGKAQSPATAPQIRVTLTSPVYHIQIDPRTFAPYMPKNVIAKAEVIGVPTGTLVPTEFTWRVMLDWNNEAYPTRHSIADKTFVHSSPFMVNFGEEIRGGTLKVFAKTTINGQEIAGFALAQIVGSNPPKRAIYKLLPPNRTGLLLAKIATVESRVQQFREPEGLPKESISHDFGIMQINAPSGAVTSADEIWDWRENVQRGIEMFTGKRRISITASRNMARREPIEDLPVNVATTIGLLNMTRALFEMQQLAPPSIPLLSELPGSGIETEENDRDKLNLTQLERDSIRRYNGGREYAFVLTSDVETLDVVSGQWQVDPTRGGISMRSGDPNYVRKVIEADSGFVIPASPKPAVSKKATQKRIRRTRKH